MKIKRYKKAERHMALYKNNFAFREPYQVLLDGTFCQVALAHKVNIQDQLPKYLGGTCKLLTTACIIDETKRLGKLLHGAYLIVSQFPVHDCGHEKPISASKCLSSFILDSKNKDHYLLATQDYQLRLKIERSGVACPLIKLANNALVMSKPTSKVHDKVSRKHHYLANKMKDGDVESLLRLKKEEKVVSKVEKSYQKQPKKRTRKGPNPLSCKKKTKKINGGATNDRETRMNSKKRHRKRVSISRHVKKVLQESPPKTEKN